MVTAGDCIQHNIYNDINIDLSVIHQDATQEIVLSELNAPLPEDNADVYEDMLDAIAGKTYEPSSDEDSDSDTTSVSSEEMSLDEELEHLNDTMCFSDSEADTSDEEVIDSDGYVTDDSDRDEELITNDINMSDDSDDEGELVIDDVPMSEDSDSDEEPTAVATQISNDNEADDDSIQFIREVTLKSLNNYILSIKTKKIDIIDLVTSDEEDFVCTCTDKICWCN